MKSLLAGLFMALSLSACSTVNDNYTNLASVRLEVTDSSYNELGHGTSVYIGNGYFITAAHVVNSMTDENRLVAKDVFNRKYNDFEVIWSNSNYDVALIKTDNKIDVPPAFLECRNLKQGERVYTIGNPMEENFIYSEGIIQSFEIKSNPVWKEYVITDMKVYGGNSGGPVYDMGGDLIGIVVGGLTINDVPIGINYIVPSSTLCKLLNG